VEIFITVPFRYKDEIWQKYSGNRGKIKAISRKTTEKSTKKVVFIDFRLAIAKKRAIL